MRISQGSGARWAKRPLFILTALAALAATASVAAGENTIDVELIASPSETGEEEESQDDA